MGGFGMERGRGALRPSPSFSNHPDDCPSSDYMLPDASHK